MHRPTARVLTVLEILQSRKISGRELARRLEVDGRTVRRYVATLQEMGIPVEGERGRYGAYSLKRGYKMPPLMFTDGEALGLALGLLAARGLGLADLAPAVEGALAKVERVMPETLRDKLRTLEQTVTLSVVPPVNPPDSGVVSGLAGAVGERRRVRLRYRSVRREETSRVVDPYAVLQREGRWHLFGHCHLRGGARLFRLDRMLGTEVLDETFERPPELDAPEAVLGAVANAHGPWEVEVLLQTSMERAREGVTPMLASLEETEGGVLMRCTTGNLDGMARVVAGLFYPLVVRNPPELRDALKRHATEVAALAERTEDKVPS
ncbi:MAG: transcriptional regulator [Actinobacteria bacterium]|nr:YafY family transcriptional regulator [Actinomycetota bacterium]PLS86291.1 MAG: transcriptional regulator [Actinomycetota bacterium]